MSDKTPIELWREWTKAINELKKSREWPYKTVSTFDAIEKAEKELWIEITDNI